MNPLIILGNGASLKDVDFTVLSNQDTFGLNNAFRRFQEMDWYPKYYGAINLQGSKLDYTGIIQFIKDNYLKIDKFFLQGECFKEWLTIGRVQPINICNFDTLNIDLNKYTFPLPIEISMALDLITDEEERKCFIDYVHILNHQEAEKLYKLNKVGILKTYRQEPVDDSCFINKPRYQESWCLPKSFDKFTFFGANSAVVAVLAGHLMGYEKIILLGVDCHWQIDNNIVDTKNTYWMENYFNEAYDIREFCSRCTGESLQRMHLDSWQNLKEAFEVNDVKIDIVNANPTSALECFRKSTLEREL